MSVRTLWIKTRLRKVISFITFTFLSFWIYVVYAGAPYPVFFEDPLQALPSPPLESGLRARYVHVQKEALIGKQGEREPEGITLNLFQDSEWIAMRERVEWRSEESFTWFGQIAGVPLSQVTLTYEHQSGWVGGIVIPDSGEYSLQREDGDLYKIIEVKDSKVPEAQDLVLPEELGLSPSVLQQNSVMDPPITLPGPVPPDDGSVIDVLVAYTSAANQTVGGSIHSWIQNAVDNSNQAYQNSGIELRMRLVHKYQTTYVETGGNLVADLNGVATTNDGKIEEVHGYRDQYGADLVVLMTGAAGTSAAGLGILVTPSNQRASYGFSVVNIDPTNAGYTIQSVSNTFAHEIGHNLGCAHDPANAGAGGAFPYSYGYASAGNLMGTLMSYVTMRVVYFSTPQRTTFGTVIGSDLVNNSLSITHMKSFIARYKTAVVPDPDILPASASVAKTSFAGCFIATAAYGSLLEEEVQTFRKFRDHVLAPSPWGRAALRTYYLLSPPIAWLIQQSPLLKSVAQGLLRPILIGIKHWN